MYIYASCIYIYIWLVYTWFVPVSGMTFGEMRIPKEEPSIIQRPTATIMYPNDTCWLGLYVIATLQIQPPESYIQMYMAVYAWYCWLGLNSYLAIYSTATELHVLHGLGCWPVTIFKQTPLLAILRRASRSPNVWNRET